MDFKGYEGKYKPSEISGKPRLYYDRNKPFTKKLNSLPLQFLQDISPFRNIMSFRSHNTALLKNLKEIKFK
jgi:hypothetical protein